MNDFWEWRDSVDQELVEREMLIRDLADILQKSYDHVSKVLRGVKRSQGMIDDISEFLGIESYTYSNDHIAEMLERERMYR